MWQRLRCQVMCKHLHSNLTRYLDYSVAYWYSNFINICWLKKAITLFLNLSSWPFPLKYLDERHTVSLLLERSDNCFIFKIDSFNCRHSLQPWFAVTSTRVALANGWNFSVWSTKEPSLQDILSSCSSVWKYIFRTERLFQVTRLFMRLTIPLGRHALTCRVTRAEITHTPRDARHSAIGDFLQAKPHLWRLRAEAGWLEEW